jgi:hypothetical protein
MAFRSELAGVPSFRGEVTLFEFTPHVTPTFDEAFQTQTRAVDPIPNFAAWDVNAEVSVVHLDAPRSTFNHNSTVKVHKPLVEERR